MPTNRKPVSLRVNREVEIFWDTTGFISAWLMSALRAHGVQLVCAHGQWQAIFLYGNTNHISVPCKKK